MTAETDSLIYRVPRLPIHHNDPAFADPMNRLRGGLEVAAKQSYRQFTATHPDQEFTFAHALSIETDLVRDYDVLIAQAGGATVEQRLETLHALRDEYVQLQQRFHTLYGYIPGGGAHSLEVQAVDAVLAELDAV